MPAVEITHQVHALGIGRPNQKTVHLQFGDEAAAKAEPGLTGVAGVEKVYVVAGNIGKESLFHYSVLQSLVFSAIFLCAEFCRAR